MVAVVGAGTLGLLVIGALTHLASTGRCPTPSVLLVGARYPHQQRLARELGATEALPPDQLARSVRRHSRSLSYGGASGVTATLTSGADVVIDCVGSAESIAQSLSMVRPRGTVSLVGMPGKVTVDLAPLWHREVRLAVAYAYGTERGACSTRDGGPGGNGAAAANGGALARPGRRRDGPRLRPVRVTEPSPNRSIPR